MANRTCGVGKMPVPSQDSFLWYLAARMGLKVRRVNMKSCGWEHRPVREFSMEALKG